MLSRVFLGRRRVRQAGVAPLAIGATLVSLALAPSPAPPAAAEASGAGSAGTTHIPAPGDQYFPAVGSDGTNYLVVWQDIRAGPGGDIYGTRVSAQGAVLDPGGIPISTGAGAHGYPSVAYDGVNYLVVWELYYGDGAGDVFGARVSPTGIVLDPGGFPISTAVRVQGWPVVAFDGTNYLVAWHDNRAGVGQHHIYGARVSRGGTVLDPGGIPISTQSNSWGALSLSIAFGGASYLVAWTDQPPDDINIIGVRVARDRESYSIQPGFRSPRP